jgi:hypothetical protein
MFRALKEFNSDIQEFITDKILIFDKEVFENYPEYQKDELLESINKMDSLNKSFILIDLEEYWDWNIFKSHADTFTELHKFLSANINVKKVILMTEDCNFEILYDKWCEQNNIKDKIHVIGYPGIFQTYSFAYKDIWTREGTGIPEIIKYKDRTTNPTRNFMCLMGNSSPDRNILQEFFNNNNLWDSNYISYIGNNEGKDPILLPNSGVMKEIVVGNSSAYTDNLGYYFNDSYFSFIPESNKWNWTGGPGVTSLFLTEKTTKVLAHGHPFIMLCSVGALKQLREWGFETFPELFDESYDDIEERFERDAFIKKEILRVGSMNKDELRKICESVEEKCINNQKILFEGEKMIKQFMDKIKRIYEDE